MTYTGVAHRTLRHKRFLIHSGGDDDVIPGSRTKLEAVDHTLASHQARRNEDIVAKFVHVDAIGQALEAEVVELIAVELTYLRRTRYGRETGHAGDLPAGEGIFIGPAVNLCRQQYADVVMRQQFEVDLVVLRAISISLLTA